MVCELLVTAEKLGESHSRGEDEVVKEGLAEKECVHLGLEKGERGRSCCVEEEDPV